MRMRGVSAATIVTVCLFAGVLASSASAEGTRTALPGAEAVLRSLGSAGGGLPTPGGAAETAGVQYYRLYLDRGFFVGVVAVNPSTPYECQVLGLAHFTGNCTLGSTASITVEARLGPLALALFLSGEGVEEGPVLYRGTGEVGLQEELTFPVTFELRRLL
jgi:hypothetical protein